MMSIYETRLKPEYERQQRYLNEIAQKLGVVCYRPNYHAKSGDKNTVLLYTKENHEYNSKLPDWASNEEYRPYFWSFENTDANGIESYQFANHGRIDLRGLKEQETLEAEIVKALDKFKADNGADK